jgi:non-specific serine/threonine protein kinase
VDASNSPRGGDDRAADPEGARAVDAERSTTFGQLLQQYRLRAGLTQEALAERAGLGRRSIQGLERGESRPHRDTVQQLARTLGLSPAGQVQFAEAAAPAPRRRRAAPALHVLHLPADPREKLPRHNLPLQLTSFVGREHELVEVKRLLGSTRLLTLTGTGGCGKTRLALQVADNLAGSYPDGVWFVDLATVSDPGLVPQAVTLTLGVRVDAQKPIQATLERYLQDRRVLLVLDNCEHLIGACARFVADTLPKCPDLTILATSRESLRIAAEVSWSTPPLAAPDPGRWLAGGKIPVTEVAAYEGVRLFLDRARAVEPSFALMDQNAAAVAEICWRLDGIPLAIELAAARVSLLGVEQIAGRLDDRFRLLTQGMREALPRHRTLRALVDWSFELLSASERVLFRRLSVYTGTFDLEAVEAVCAGGSLAELDVLEALGGLVGKSLVLRVESGGPVRYRLLETIRQYAWERLDEADEMALVRRRYGDWYLGLAERANVEVWGAVETTSLARLDLDNPNLRETLRWFRDNDPTAGLQLAISLYRFWFDRGLVAEGRRWLEELLERVPDRTLLRARALFGLGWLAFYQGDGATVKSALGSSIPIYRENHDARGAGRSLYYLGRVAEQDACYEEAEALYQSGLELLRKDGDRPGIAMVLYYLGYLLLARGEDAEAAALLAESRVIFRELRGQGGRDFFVLPALANLARLHGDAAEARALTIEGLAVQRAMEHRELVVQALDRLAELARAEGNYTQAQAFLAEGLELAQEVGTQPLIGRVLTSLARLCQSEGDDGQARALFQQGLRLAHTIGNHGVSASCFGGLGMLAIQQGGWVAGVRLIGAARRLDQLYPGPFDPTERVQCRERLDLARSALGEEDFAQAWTEGRAMTLEQAVAYALEEDGR